MGLGLGLWERNPPHSPLSSLPGATIPQSLATHLLTWSRLGWEEAEPGTPGASGQLWAEKGQGDGRMGCGARKKRGVGWGLRLLKVRATLRRESSHPGPHAVPRCPEERGPHQFLHTFKTPPSSPAPDLPRAFYRGPGHLSFSPGGKLPRCALASARPGTVQRAARSAPAPQGPFRAVQSLSPPGPPAPPARTSGR